MEEMIYGFEDWLDGSFLYEKYYDGSYLLNDSKKYEILVDQNKLSREDLNKIIDCQQETYNWYLEDDKEWSKWEVSRYIRDSINSIEALGLAIEQLGQFENRKVYFEVIRNRKYRGVNIGATVITSTMYKDYKSSKQSTILRMPKITDWPSNFEEGKRYLFYPTKEEILHLMYHANYNRIEIYKTAIKQLEKTIEIFPVNFLLLLNSLLSGKIWEKVDDEKFIDYWRIRKDRKDFLKIQQGKKEIFMKILLKLCIVSNPSKDPQSYLMKHHIGEKDFFENLKFGNGYRKIKSKIKDDYSINYSYLDASDISNLLRQLNSK